MYFFLICGGGTGGSRDPDHPSLTKASSANLIIFPHYLSPHKFHEMATPDHFPHSNRTSGAGWTHSDRVPKLP